MFHFGSVNYVGASEFHEIKYLLAQKESMMYLYYPINSKMCLAESFWGILCFSA